MARIAAGYNRHVTRNQLVGRIFPSMSVNHLYCISPPIQCFIHWLCAHYKLFLWLWLWLLYWKWVLTNFAKRRKRKYARQLYLFIYLFIYLLWNSYSRYNIKIQCKNTVAYILSVLCKTTCNPSNVLLNRWTLSPTILDKSCLPRGSWALSVLFRCERCWLQKLLIASVVNRVLFTDIY